ncbi:MAG: NEW3 domain-containing protein [Thermoplasmatota archaeon]
MALLVALALVLSPSLVAPPANATFNETLKSPGKPGVQYQWWNATWHFRVPVILRPRIRDTLTDGTARPQWADLTQPPAQNFLATTQIDFTGVVKAAGAGGTGPQWPLDAFGNLQSFTFDPNSVRVVEYDYDHGTIAYGAGESGVLPSTFYPGFFDTPFGANGVYNATANAVGTVQILIPNSFDTQVLVFVYFDILENGAKAPPVYQQQDQGILDSAQWTHAATTVYGYLPAYTSSSAPSDPVLGVMALFQNTTVEVASYNQPGQPPIVLQNCNTHKLKPCYTTQAPILPQTASHLPTLTINGRTGLPSAAQSILEVDSPGAEMFFRVQATKPVLVYMYTPQSQVTIAAHWVPAVDGGPVGTTFVFPGLGTTYPCNSACNGGSDSLRVFAPDGYGNQLATVSIQDMSTQGSGNPETCLVPAGSSASIDNCGGSVTYQLGHMYYVTSDSPIALASTGVADSFGIPGISAGGGPVGSPVFLPIDSTSAVSAFGPTAVDLQKIDLPKQSVPSDGSQVTLTGTGATATWVNQQFSHELLANMYAVNSQSAAVSALAGTYGFWEPGGAHGGLDFRVSAPRPNVAPGPIGTIIPLYNETTISIENLTTNRDLPTLTLSEDQFTRNYQGQANSIIESTQASQTSTFLIHANKPIVIAEGHEPVQAPYGGFYAGKLASPDYQIGNATFYGCVIGFNPADKDQQQTVVPGTPLSFTARIENLGVGLNNAPIIDNITIQPPVRIGGTGWPLTISPLRVPNIRSGTQVPISISVNVPSTARTGDNMTLSIVAQSQCNPLIEDTAQIKIRVETKHQLTLQFVDVAGGTATEQTRLMQGGHPENFTLNATNTGSGPDSFTFEIAPSAVADQLGWSRHLFDATGFDYSTHPNATMALKSGQTVFLNLEMIPPPDTQSVETLDTVVQGTSTNDSSAIAQATLHVILNAVTSINLNVDKADLPIAPGKDAFFNFTVVNNGSQTIVSLANTLTAAGWNASFIPSSTVNLQGRGDPNHQDRARVELRVRTPSEAAVGFATAIKVTATAVTASAAGTSVASQVVTAHVVNNFSVATPILPRQSRQPGDAIVVPLHLKNTANGNYTIRVVPFDIPPGWTFNTSSVGGALFAPVGLDAPTISPEIDVLPNAPPGVYLVGIGLFMNDSVEHTTALTPLYFETEVRQVLEVRASLPSNLTIPPGKTTRVPVTLRNVGNENATIVAPNVNAPAGWNVTPLDAPNFPITLPPGGALLDNFSVQAPSNPVGPSANVSAQVFYADGTPGLRTSTPISILRRSLAIHDVQVLTHSYQVGSTAVFEVNVTYQSTEPAANVEVALFADGKLAENFTIDQFPPNAYRIVPIAWTVTPASTLTFEVDPHRQIPVENRTGSSYGINLQGQVSRGLFAGILPSLPTPGPNPVLVILAALGVAFLARRRRA